MFISEIFSVSMRNGVLPNLRMIQQIHASKHEKGESVSPLHASYLFLVSPGLNEEHTVWTPGLGLSVNLWGRSIKENKQTKKKKKGEAFMKTKHILQSKHI